MSVGERRVFGIICSEALGVLMLVELLSGKLYTSDPSKKGRKTCRPAAFSLLGDLLLLR